MIEPTADGIALATSCGQGMIYAFCLIAAVLVIGWVVYTIIDPYDPVHEAEALLVTTDTPQT